VYRTFTAAPGARISLQLGDLGHPRGQNKALADDAMLDQANSFLDAYLKGAGRRPRHGSVLAFTQTCPASARPGGPLRAENWERLHPRSVTIRQRRTQRIDSRRGSLATAQAIDPVGSSGACATARARRERGTVTFSKKFGKPFTMLGLPIVEARIRTKGRGGLIAARLWDVQGAKQTLVSRGVYRLRDNQRGRIVFQLFGNGWRFNPPYTAKVELLGRDPNFLRTSNFKFSVRVSGARVLLPGR
jgi:hypothetical protein